MVLVLSASLAATGFDYFGRYASQPTVAAAFVAPARTRGELAASLAAEGPAYAMPMLWNQSVVRFLCLGQDVRSFDPQAGLVIPGEARLGAAPRLTGRVRYLCDPAEFDRCASALSARRIPELRWSILRTEPGDPVLGVLELPAGARLPAWVGDLPDPEPVFGEAIELCGLSIVPTDRHRVGEPQESVRPGDTLTIGICWRARQPTQLDHNFFVHLLDSREKSAGQRDGSPLDGSYPTDTWKPGDMVLQWLEAVIASDAQAGPLRVRTGFYDWRTLKRLPLPGSADDAFELDSGLVLGQD